jgi:hypothetical protein
MYNFACPSAMQIADSAQYPLVVNMVAGIQTPSFDPSTASNIPAGTQISAVDDNLKSGRLAQYSLQLQKELRSNILTVGYVGNLGRHLLVVPNINQATYAIASGAGCSSTNFNACTFQQMGVPYPALGASGITISDQQSGSTSNYNAMEVTLERRFAAGLTANINYTWAHALNDGSPQGEGGSRAVECVRYGCIEDMGNGSTKIVNGIHYNYGPSDLDVRDRLAMMIDYSLPFGKSLAGIQGAIVKGWTANAAWLFSTDMPASIMESNFNYSGINGLRSDAPNQIGNPNAGHIHTISRWFNTDAYHAQTPGELGNVQGNSIYGPHQPHLDFSLAKDFALYEAMTLQFRAEAFNLSNTPNFAEPDTGLGSPTFGQISSTTTGSTPRQLQFALRLSF